MNRNGAITEHTFYTQNGTIVGETRRNPNGTVDRLEFIYDEAGRPLQLIFNGRIYNYVLNLQGDVQQIRRATDGVVVATYLYNAWGQLLQSSGVMAESNPLRYRGYFYDTSSGLYYLNSRYYDPVIGRFLNADATWVLGVEQGTLLQYNLFAYCNNNPVNFYDPDGYLAFLAIPLIIGAVKKAVAATTVTVVVANTIQSAAFGMAAGAATAYAASALRGECATLRTANTIVGGTIGLVTGTFAGIITSPLAAIPGVTAAVSGFASRFVVNRVLGTVIGGAITIIPAPEPVLPSPAQGIRVLHGTTLRTTATASNTTQAARNHTYVLTSLLQ